jgi:hypothetical protein
VTQQGLVKWRALLEKEDDNVQELAKKCTETLSAREGFVLDGAAATAASFVGGRANDGELSALSAWLTPAWLGRAHSLIGVVRWRRDKLDNDEQTNSFDVGTRAVYAWRRIAASGEIVYRTVRQSGDSKTFTRLSLILDAKAAEQSWLSLTLGKDFDPKAANSLLAILGFKWQLGEQRVKPDVRMP